MGALGRGLSFLALLALLTGAPLPGVGVDRVAHAAAGVFGGRLIEMLPTGSLIGDGATSVRLYVLMLEPDATPIEGLEAKVTVSGGVPGELVRVSPGLYQVDWVPPMVDAARDIEITLRGKTPDKAKVVRTWAVSVLPRVHEHLRARGLDLRRLLIVPNGIDPQEWAGPSEPLRADVAAVLADSRAAGRTVVGYAGSMGLPNALDTLLDAAALLRGEAVQIVLVGDGHERQRLAGRIAAQQLVGVSLLPAIPKAQVPAFLGAVDIAYLGWRRQPLYRFGIAPNKLMDYMMAGCAVLHAVEAGNDPVAEAGCGLTVAPEDPGAVARGVLELAALPLAQRRALGARGRAHVLAHHTYPVLARRFAQALAGEDAQPPPVFLSPSGREPGAARPGERP